MRELLLAATTAAAFGGLAANQVPQTDFRSEARASAPTMREFVLQSAGADCALWQGPADFTGHSPLTLGNTCSEALPALADATQWLSKPDGLVVLANARGDTLVEFAPADGEGLETFQPGVPPASLREIE